MRKIVIGLLTLVLLLCVAAAEETLDYSNPELWAYYGSEEGTQADVFFIAPTNVHGDENQPNADLSNSDDVTRILASIGMQTGIYNTEARFFAPYYRQATRYCYTISDEERETYICAAAQDVEAAFEWYMQNENNGRPLIIAGFSQGADIGLRVLKSYAENQDFQEQLIAAYLIGWRVTKEDLDEYPVLKMAQNETDTGVIICFDCEAEFVTDTIVVPTGVFSYSINPLNWKTDSTAASKEENLGYVYPNADGSVKTEIPQLCGAYIDPERGVLKVTDVTPEEYPTRSDFFPEGSYHIYDYEFFYRNLQKNVETRIQAYLSDK